MVTLEPGFFLRVALLLLMLGSAYGYAPGASVRPQTLGVHKRSAVAAVHASVADADALVDTGLWDSLVAAPTALLEHASSVMEQAVQAGSDVVAEACVQQILDTSPSDKPIPSIARLAQGDFKRLSHTLEHVLCGQVSAPSAVDNGRARTRQMRTARRAEAFDVSCGCSCESPACCVRPVHAVFRSTR